MVIEQTPCAGRHHGRACASARAINRLTRDTDGSNSRANAVISVAHLDLLAQSPREVTR